ncbi:ABC transporter substrate-binding protein [Actinoallomurus soli]|uniref:ABC transporter substrate-binding protein n=1 Tax=Actinoallomurus soli TaxID=2952535 RepID=UPI0020939CF2|nr:ABC transporter substrate-binding protein [Actinoallomurus soli]MCO5971398.1 ABC transporter substrate-binding protein [Actinoallomurus soli]
MTVCAQLPYKPFEYTENGKVVGFDIAMLDLAAKRLGVTVQVIDTPFETIKTGAELNAGRCDVGAGGMTITDERKKYIDFSDPYFEATQTLLAGPKVKATTLDQIKAAKLRIGSLASTTGEEYLTGHGFDPKSYDLADALLNGLRTGDVDVIIMDSPVVAGWLKDPKNSGFHVVADLRTGERYGFAFRKGHSGPLVRAVNAAIGQARADGSYARTYERWIGPYRGAR